MAAIVTVAGSTVTTLSAADIVTLGPTQAHVHTTGTQPVTLPELQWLVYAPYDVWGTAVQFTAGPFVNAQHPQYSADCQLNIRLIRTAGPAQWQIGVPYAATNVAQQHAAAIVAASSTGQGAAVIGLQATFLPPSGRPVPAGEYVTQVVGLVTGI